MTTNLTHRKAMIQDLRAIIGFFLEADELSVIRERLDTELDQRYVEAFSKIDKNPDHYLMVVELDSEIVETCHLTLLPSLTLVGSTRMQIEAVRVSEKHRGKKIGEWMINQAVNHAKSHGASILQLTTNKKRLKAKRFYEKLGFEASHEGMKLDLRNTHF